MSEEKQSIFEELRGQLEALGMQPPVAERLAGAQAQSARGTEGRKAAQHVVPVSRGWLVVRPYVSLDAETYPTRAEAEQRACLLAREDSSVVIVHDANGEIEREIDVSA